MERKLTAKEQFAEMKRKKLEDAAAATEKEAERQKGLESRRVSSFATGGGGKSMREKRETELKMSAMHTSWYEEAHRRAVNWDDKKRQLFIAMKRFVCVTFTEQTRKRLDEIPEYKQWLEKLEAKQKRVCNKRSTAMARFAVGDAVAGAVSDVANEMLHGVSADTPPKKRMEAVMTNAKGRGLTMPQIFGFFLGRTLDEALKMEMTEELEEELYRTELTKEQFGDALQRLDKHLFERAATTSSTSSSRRSTRTARAPSR